MLSHNGGLNCASCHNSNQAFIDNRITLANGIVSQGDNPTKYGKRNSPTMLYAKFIQVNSFSDDFVDLGLYENPNVKEDKKQKGEFKTPTLRNCGSNISLYAQWLI
ncbi:cytochrome c peroxidase [Mannheimia indoligenes]|uniref:cytochrome c peroxidase n=1 Tax=Mannheimia indoligenes TaxID=3103145 RepID=UPI002FE63432